MAIPPYGKETMKDYHDLAYEELKQLHADIGQLLEDKKEEVLEDMRTKLQDLGLNASDLMKKPNAKVYANPENPEQTWGGGRGRKPAWLTELLDKGADLEELRVA
jgi:DNA-binding protein H-NS